MFHVRWKQGAVRVGKEFTDHSDPAIEAVPCLICVQPIGAETGPYRLVAVGPTNAEDQQKYDDGKWINAGAVLAHSDCVDHVDDYLLSKLCSFYTEENN